MTNCMRCGNRTEEVFHFGVPMVDADKETDRLICKKCATQIQAWWYEGVKESIVTFITRSG
jgi:transcription elongation factor Elf1